jgi:hypothetical protein
MRVIVRPRAERVTLGRESRAAAPNRSEHLELNSGSTRSIPRTTLSPMAMGKRRRRPKQTSMWVATHDLPLTAAIASTRR